MFDLTGKSVVVTGGGRGIGRGISRAMATAGAGVVVCGRTESALDDAVTELRGIGARVVPIVADITRPADVDRVVATAVAELGAIDCWVNNAGSARPEDVGPLMDLDESGWTPWWTST